MKKIYTLILITVLFSSSSCIGTMYTRNADVVGKYPYEAVALGLNILVGSTTELEIFPELLFIMLPLDFIADTLLLPADLICWPLGAERSKPLGW